MLLHDGKQIIEGIDSIALKFQPYIIPFLHFEKTLDPRKKISIYNTQSVFQFNAEIYFKRHWYLHISGEYIHPELPLKEIIAAAIHQLFIKKVLCIPNTLKNTMFTEISQNLILDNLSLFISGISTIEFCFDFKRENIMVSPYAKIIETSTDEFINLKKIKLKDRPKCLIKEKTTYYSCDYKGNRKSVLKLYDREIWLPKKGNEYTHDFIQKNPYKMRLEFVLKRHQNTQYLTLNNLEGNVTQVIKRFTLYLAKLYRDYFLGLIKVNCSDYPNFSKIYTIAHDEAISRSNELENYNKTRVKGKKLDECIKYSKLLSLLKKEDRKADKLLSNPPNTYFAGFDNLPDLMKNHSITPYDLINDDKVLLKDEDGFIFLKDSGYMPTFKTVENDNEN